MKILIADDDKLLVQYLDAALRAKGCQVFSAFDAMQAVMFAQRNAPDAIVLDINMPAGSGLDALKKLRVLAKTSMIPVLVISSVTNPAVPEQAKTLGAAEFLPKPVDIERLYASICRLTGKAAA